MSWVITGSEKTPVDPVFNNVSLLLHGNGANGSTTITDSSRFANTVTAVGNTQISTAQSKFDGASIAFDGTGDYLTIPTISFDRLESLTLEAWIYKTARDASGYTILLGGPNNVQIAFDNTTEGSVSMYFDGVQAVNAVGTAVTTNAWNHVAWVRQLDTCLIYVNGILMGSGINAGPFSVTRIGARATTGYEMNGYIDDLRITKGVARYTSNFTPPTAPFPDI
jgi:hypothetical protein